MPEEAAAPAETQTEATESEVTEQPVAESDEETTSQEDDASDDWRKNFDADKASERIRKLQSENKSLRSRAKDAEAKAEGVEEKDSRIANLERELLRERVARKLNLPDALVDRLRGDTEEELLDDAQKLVDLVAPRKGEKPKPANPDAGPRDSAPTEVSDHDLDINAFLEKRKRTRT